MITCFVCREETNSGHSHHVLLQSRPGGKEGPQVPLCADHHTLLHKIQVAMKAGKAPEPLLVGLEPETADRLMALVQLALMADIQHGSTNPHPILMAVLDTPELMEGMKRAQRSL